MEQSESISRLAKALCAAQKEALFALTTSENPYFKSKYADLSSVWDVAREPLTKNGLAVAQTMGRGRDGSPVIVTTLMHESGEWIRGELEMKPNKPDPQSVGSAITYGRRYSLAAIVGICPEDDDAEGAMKRGKESGEKEKDPLPEPPDVPATDHDGPVTEAQLKKISAMITKAKMDRIQVKLILKVESLKELTKDRASNLIEKWDDFVGVYRAREGAERCSL